MAAGRSPGLRKAGLRRAGNPGAAGGAAGGLLASNNLSDVADAPTARANLGVGDGTGDMVGSNNLSDIDSPSVARFNLQLGSLAVVDSVDLLDAVAQNADNLSELSDPAAALVNLGLPAALAAALADYLSKAGNLAGLADLPTARGNLGLGSMAVETATNYALQSALEAAIAGLRWKAPARLATTVNGALATAFAAGQVLDGVAVVAGDRLLLKNQTAGAENGIYVAQASGPPVRATDGDTAAELLQAAIFVSEGTAGADKAFILTNNAITLGTTALTFTPFATALGAVTQAYVDAGDAALAASLGNLMVKSQNLADVANPATARSNLGIGARMIEIAAAALGGAATSYTSPAWTAGAYREILVVWEGSPLTNVSVSFPGVSGTAYCSGFSSTAPNYSLASGLFVQLGVGGGDVEASGWFRFCPRQTGRRRFVHFQSASYNTTGPRVHFDVGSGIVDETATEITQLMLTFSAGATPTGNVWIYGIPA